MQGITRDSKYLTHCFPQYQIHCISDSQYERQGPLSLSRLFASTNAIPTSAAIRIFGIFTHAQICHGGFWDTLSRQLQQQGPEYIKRCTFRSEPLSAGNNVISPATFPSLPYLVEDLPPAAPLVKVSEEDMKDVSEIGIVSKTVTKYMRTDPFHACVRPSRHHLSSHNSYIV